VGEQRRLPAAALTYRNIGGAELWGIAIGGQLWAATDIADVYSSIVEEHGTRATSADSPYAKTGRPGRAPTTASTIAESVRVPARSQSGVSTPAEAIELDEVERMRIFLGFVAFVAASVVALTLVLPGDRGAAIVLGASSAVTSTLAVVLLLVIRDRTRYRTWQTIVFGHFAATTVVCSTYYFGVYSGVLLIIPIGTYFFALGRSFAGALSIQLNVTVGHAVVTGLQVAGVIDDVGVVASPQYDTTYLIAMLLVIQFVFAATFVMARGLRRSTIGVMEQLDGAIRDNAQREALLNEAKQDLAQALRIGGPGRYTEQVIGSFKLGVVIGRGAMGEVYEAIHAQTGEPAAVKLLGREAMLNPDHVARFLREVHIAASLRVENVVRVLEAPNPGSAVPYLAMERLHGETLADVLRREPMMNVSDVSHLMQALARGIGAAHAAGIVHRDLKPGNVFRQETGETRVWKILDFGVSKLIDHGGTLTQGHIIGTPGYMAPEQARGVAVDHRADLYALGVIAYRVLTGRPAFSGKDIPAILRAVAYDMPPRPSDIAPIARDFDVVLAIAMAKDPARRFATADELAQAFGAAATGTLGAEMKRRGAELVDEHPWRNA
jgi:eukaryotic-like serine/threonine-protein kinase